jgi:lipid A 3-O-deacylase
MRLLIAWIVCCLVLTSCIREQDKPPQTAATLPEAEIPAMSPIQAKNIAPLNTAPKLFKKEIKTQAKLHSFEEEIGQMSSNSLTFVPARAQELDRKSAKKSNISWPGHALTADINLSRYLLITFDNDIFAETDYYYTNGFSIGMIHPALKKWPVYKLMPGLGDGAITYQGIRLHQQMFTPYNPEALTIDTKDRPFAGVLFAEFFKLNSLTDKALFLQTSLRIGLIGPASMAEALQRTAHELKPTGWDFQIANDFLINMDFSLQKSFSLAKSVEIAGRAHAGIGTYKDYIGGSFQLRAGNFQAFSSPSPDLIGSPLAYNRNITYWLFVEPAFQFIGYDASLNGGMLNRNSPHRFSYDQINHWTTQISAGFSVFYRKTGISIRLIHISPEFEGGNTHKWGSISITNNF